MVSKTHPRIPVRINSLIVIVTLIFVCLWRVTVGNYILKMYNWNRKLSSFTILWIFQVIRYKNVIGFILKWKYMFAYDYIHVQYVVTILSIYSSIINFVKVLLKILCPLRMKYNIASSTSCRNCNRHFHCSFNVYIVSFPCIIYTDIFN